MSTNLEIYQDPLQGLQGTCPWLRPELVSGWPTSKTMVEAVTARDKKLKTLQSALNEDDIRWALRARFLAYLHHRRVGLTGWQVLLDLIAEAKAYNNAPGRQNWQRWPLSHWVDADRPGVHERLAQVHRAVIREALTTGQLKLEDLPVNERHRYEGMETVLLDDPDVRITLIGFIFPTGHRYQDWDTSLVRIKIVSRLDGDSAVTLAISGKAGRRQEYLYVAFTEIREQMPKLFRKLAEVGRLFDSINLKRTREVGLTRLVCAAGGKDVSGRQTHHEFEMRPAPYGGPPTMDCRFDSLALLYPDAHKALHRGDGHFVDREAAAVELNLGREDVVGTAEVEAEQKLTPAPSPAVDLGQGFAPAVGHRHVGMGCPEDLTLASWRWLGGEGGGADGWVDGLLTMMSTGFQASLPNIHSVRLGLAFSPDRPHSSSGGNQPRADHPILNKNSYSLSDPFALDQVSSRGQSRLIADHPKAALRLFPVHQDLVGNRSSGGREAAYDGSRSNHTRRRSSYGHRGRGHPQDLTIADVRHDPPGGDPFVPVRDLQAHP